MFLVPFAALSNLVAIAGIVGALGAAANALGLVYLGLRAQSAEKQREDLREDVKKELSELLDAPTRALVFAEALRKVLDEFGIARRGGRRFYDPDE